MTTLSNLYDNAEALETQLAEVNTAIQIELSRLAKTVTVNQRKASTVLTAENGNQIVISRRKNTYGEVKIWAHHGKKGKLLEEGVRESLHRIKIRLANGDIL